MKLDNNLRATILVCAATFSASALLVACGGGSSSASAPIATTTVFTGTIASGAAYPVGTTITAYDKNGLVAATAVTTDDTGAYSITIPAGKQAPFVFAASAPDLDTLYSFSATGAAGNVNITPITNLIAARLSPTGNPENLSANTSQITTAAVATQTQAVIDVLAPAATAVGVTLTNPMSTAFTANGQGQDQLLDALKIKITPTGSGSTASANADISIVTTAATPILIPTFSASASTTATIPAMQQGGTTFTGTIAANTVVAGGTSVQVKDLVTRIQACYALPVTDRISTNGTTAADITAAACKNLFSGNDPANYKNNGFAVSKTTDWSGIFSTTSQGALFDLAKYEFSRSNGDIVLSFRSKAADGSSVRYNSAVAKLEGTAPNQQLKVIGNQYNYDAAVRPQIHERTFVNDATYNYRATGYSFYVENKQINGNPAFDRVEIVGPATPASPSGVKFTLKPNSGYNFLVVVNPNGSLSNAGTVMLNLTSLGGTDKATIVSKTPLDWYWAPIADWSDANISAMGQQTLWTLNYFNAGNATSTPDTIETRKTLTRALTLAELSNQKLAKFTDTMLAEVRASTSTTQNFTFTTEGKVDVSANGNLDAWEVPSGAIAPTDVAAFGRAPYSNNGSGGDSSTRFNDSLSVSATTRKGIISCTRQSNADLHCGQSAVVGTPTNYAIGSRVNYFRVLGNGPGNVQVTSGMGTYKPSLNP